MDRNNTPVFIVGGSRTGSELLKNIIYLNTEIDMVPEMWLLSPPWIHKSFFSLSKINKRTKIDESTALKLVEIVFSKQCQAAFWQNIEKMEIDKNELKNFLLSTERNCGEFIAELLRLRAKARGKKVLGAKFPLHFAYTELLIEWFPGCRIIQTIRDPRASYASQLIKHKKGKVGFLSRKISDLLQFIHIMTQFIWQVNMHQKLKNNPNYMLFKYEEFVEKPEARLKEMCGFLQVDYKDNMLSPTIKNTSYGQVKKSTTEISKGSVSSWKEILSPLTIRLIKIIDGQSMAKIGY